MHLLLCCAPESTSTEPNITSCSRVLSHSIWLCVSENAKQWLKEDRSLFPSRIKKIDVQGCFAVRWPPSSKSPLRWLLEVHPSNLIFQAVGKGKGEGTKTYFPAESAPNKIVSPEFSPDTLNYIPLSRILSANHKGGWLEM